jgi:outer membrane lipoprotein SlyB
MDLTLKIVSPVLVFFRFNEVIMKSIFKSFMAITLIGLSVAACTPSLSSDTYVLGSAGQVSRVVKGTIVSARTVTVEAGGNNMVGTLGGGAAGALAGSALGGGRGSALFAVGGALAGGVLGNRVENSLNKQQGIEYTIKTKNGLISVVQGPNPTFQRGQHVLVSFGGGGEGSRGRVTSDPDYE